MSNFKSGSGNLDFGSNDDDDEEPEASTETTQTTGEEIEDAESAASEESTAASKDRTLSDSGPSSSRSMSDPAVTEASTTSEATTEKYPYFVRRSNVGDERETRLEIHVRDKIADQEANFRNELAENLGVSEVSKTDAREFALLAAFHNPERVAELMQDEGFGTLS